MSYHKILEKQLQKTLTPEQINDPALKPFLYLIDRTYKNFENDISLADHAFSTTEKEYQEVLNDLQAKDNIHQQSVKKVKAAITSLDASGSIPDEGEDNDLIQVISYLEKQVQKSKLLETELVHAKEQAELAARIKSDFLSVMSHEIRTPLNAIIGIAHLLMQDELLPSQLENLRVLNISAENLLNLVNDILDFGKIEDGKIVLSEKNVDLRKLAGNIRMANRIRAEERGNTLKLVTDPDLPPLVKADEVRLGQILNNLVSNAVKFTRKGCITIDLKVMQATDDLATIQFSVSDTGIGIAREKQQLIFDRFTQASSDIAREYGGSGLGLTIVKRLLTLHQSDIRIDSEPDHGSRFFFDITFKKTDEEPIADSKGLNGRGDLNGLKVLLVEDVEFNVMVAEKMITNWKAKVDVAENGVEAISKARQFHYDIILMDLQMPVMDGYSASKHIRGFNDSIPIIALTASSSPEILQKTQDFGIDDYLAKPFNPSELFGIIQKYTRKNGQPH